MIHSTRAGVTRRSGIIASVGAFSAPRFLFRQTVRGCPDAFAKIFPGFSARHVDAGPRYPDAEFGPMGKWSGLGPGRPAPRARWGVAGRIASGACFFSVVPRRWAPLRTHAPRRDAPNRVIHIPTKMSFAIAQTAAVARASAAPSARPTARRAANVAPMRAARVNVVAAVDLNGARRSRARLRFPSTSRLRRTSPRWIDDPPSRARPSRPSVRSHPDATSDGPHIRKIARRDATPRSRRDGPPATRELTPSVPSPATPPPIFPQPSPSRTPRRSSWTPTPSPSPPCGPSPSRSSS